MTHDNPNENTNNPKKAPRLLSVPRRAPEMSKPATVANLPALLVEGGKAGKEGSAPRPVDLVTNADFVAAVLVGIPTNASAAVCSKQGDPDAGGFVARAAKKVNDQCPPDRNNYLNCSSFVAGSMGLMQARKEKFAALHFVGLDDVGTKVGRERLGGFVPTWEIETSPGNSQLGIRLTEPITDLADAEALSSAISSAGLSDPGANGVIRWFRQPQAINGKAKYRSSDGKPFACRLAAWNPEESYTPAQLFKAFGLVASAQRPSVVQGPRLSAPEQGDDVYAPRPAESPVVTALKAAGLYKREIGPGKHDVTCPWVDEHGDRLDTGAAYFEPSNAFPMGGFCCQHSHRDEYHVGKLLDRLGVSVADARWKPRIRVVPGEINRVVASADKVLAQRGEHYQAGGVIVSISRDPDSGDISTVPATEQALTSELAAAADWEKFDGRKGAWVRCDPPPRHVNMLHRAQSYAHLPPLAGLARQPFFREGDGELVTAPGYDAISHRLAVFEESDFAIPEPTREAAGKALDLILDLIGEFRFSTDEDRAAAVAAIFTAVVRPSLEVAPAFHVNAPSMGSGKSYFCALTTAFAGPGESLKVSFPQSAEEATKTIQSVLLKAPAVIEFDDMVRDWIAHAILNRMLTTGSITDRILGVSKVATLSTRTLVLGSGNNVGPVRDLLRRVVTIRLDPRTSSPATLSYKGRPVDVVRAERGKYVAAVLTVILAWQAAGRPRADVPNIASYGGAWADFCRHPLIWLGQPDPAAGLLEQIRHDPDADNFGNLLLEWDAAFGPHPTTVRKALAHSETTRGGALREALLDLPIVERDDISNSKFGWYLRRNADKIAGGFKLLNARTAERNAWRVVSVEDGPGARGPASPALPPSDGQAPAVAAGHQPESGASR